MSLEAATSATVATSEQRHSHGPESPQSTSQTTLSFPSSPPVARQSDSRDEMSPPGRKRSRDDVQDEKDRVENSATVVNENELHASQVKPSSSQVDSSTTLPSTTAAKKMAPPPVPKSLITPRASEPPPSGQGVSKLQHSQLPTQQAKGQSQQVPAPPLDKASEDSAAAMHKRTNSDDTIADESEAESESPTPSEPQIRIDAFNWSELEQRYHDKMAELDLNEQGIYHEFHDLCSVSVACSYSERLD